MYFLVENALDFIWKDKKISSFEAKTVYFARLGSSQTNEPQASNWESQHHQNQRPQYREPQKGADENSLTEWMNMPIEWEVWRLEREYLEFNTCRRIGSPGHEPNTHIFLHIPVFAHQTPFCWESAKEEEQHQTAGVDLVRFGCHPERITREERGIIFQRCYHWCG